MSYETNESGTGVTTFHAAGFSRDLFCPENRFPDQWADTKVERKVFQMKSRIAVLAMFLVVVVLGMSGAQAASGSGKIKAGKVEGTLTAASATGVVIRKAGGATVTLSITATTKIEKNGVRVPVTSLTIGNPVQALFDPSTNVASKVEGR